MNLNKHIVFVEINESSHGLNSLKSAKELGYYITLVTAGLNNYKKVTKDEAEQYIDRLISMDLYNEFDCVIEVIKTIHQFHPIDGVYGGTDFDIYHAHKLGESLNLKLYSSERIDNSRNKYKMREILNLKKVEQPLYQLIDSLECIDSKVEALLNTGASFPFIIKPVDSSASDGVKLVYNSNELYEHVKSHYNDLHFYRGFYKSKDMILEEFIKGDIVSVELIKSKNNTYEILGITDRILSELPYFVELGGSFPAKLINEDQIKRSAIKALEALGYPFGPCHIEFVIDSFSTPKVIEVNPRLVGSTISKIISACKGQNIVKEIIKQFTGDSYCFNNTTKGYGLVTRLTADTNGKLNTIENLDYVKAIPGCLDVRVTKKPGDILVQKPKSNFDLIAEITVYGKDKAEAQTIADYCKENLLFNIEGEKNKLLI